MSAAASETIVYGYDVHGRLIEVSRTGSVNEGVSSCYGYDRADNRSNVSVATSSGCAVTSAAPSFSISDTSSVEGGGLTFSVTRSNPASGSFSVSFATANGSAVSGSDYTPHSGTLTFADGELIKSFTVSTIDDGNAEGAETMLVNLTAPTGGATIGDGQAVGTINDNDGAETPPSFAINNVSVTEGGTLVFTVTKTGATLSSYSVSFASQNGTAQSGSDYNANSGTLSFASADTAKTISIATIDDAGVESSETLLVNLSGASGGATISDGQGIGTIVDNDAAVSCSGVSFAVNDAMATEGDSFLFTVAKSGSTAASCNVDYATANGTATAPGDYTATSGVLTFAANETAKTVSVEILAGGLIEPTEYLYLNLSNPSSGATLQDSQGVGTIIDGAPCPTCVIEQELSEGGE